MTRADEILASLNEIKIKRSPTPGTNAGSTVEFDSYFKEEKLKKLIMLDGKVYPKGSLVWNIPGGVFLKAPKDSDRQSIKRTDKNLDKILRAL